ncbi:hypothetical protein [Kiloniella antarctica]|uniref:DUF304 domain-containing protein n=1 Tax=Kiloniella antarctica TaxID=1550907 RepID=A0ABW5BJN0_9PROT
MSFLFEFFLHVGARDFLPFYRELKAAGRVNPVVRAYYLRRFLGYSLLSVAIAVLLLWVLGGLTFNDGIKLDLTLNVPVPISLLVSVYLWWTMIEMVGNTLHIYSRGCTAMATVMGTKSRMGRGFNVLHRFEVAGAVVETSFNKQIGQKSYWDSLGGKELEIIYAEDNPELTLEYKAEKFMDRCLDLSRQTL